MKKNFILSGIFAFLSVLLILFIKLVDVAVIGPKGSEIGLSSLNGAINRLLGESNTWDKLTDLLMLLSIAAVLAFAVIGVIELFKRRSLFKVDGQILTLGGVVVVLAFLYVFFELVVINYRPILEDGELAASFPSSHTMLAVTLFLCVSVIVSDYIRKPKLALALKIAAIVLAAVSALGRLLSGAHWFTDVLGGVLISLAIVFLFAGLLELTKEKNTIKAEE